MTFCEPVSASWDYSTFRIGPGFWSSAPADRAADVLRQHMHRDWQIIAAYQLPIPASDYRLELVVKLAVEAEVLFWAAAIFEPGPEDFDCFFTDFIRRALQPVSAFVQ
jgi:hypothetical protein